MSGGGERFPCDMSGRRKRRFRNLTNNTCPEEKIFSVVFLFLGPIKPEAPIEHQEEFKCKCHLMATKVKC